MHSSVKMDIITYNDSYEKNFMLISFIAGMLVDSGKINLSDKLKVFIPDFPKADSITARML